MFDQRAQDFGTVPRGAILNHSFQVVNGTRSSVHVAGVCVSCGCTSAAALQSNLEPGKATSILAQMDTRRFAGVKTVTIFVQFDQPG
jgi:hypothetical protein